MRLLSLLVLAPDPIALRINAFDRRRLERNNRTRLWPRVSFMATAGAFIGDLRRRKASYIDLNYFLPDAPCLDVIIATREPADAGGVDAGGGGGGGGESFRLGFQASKRP